jgi:predicted nucleotide-binding protein
VSTIADLHLARAKKIIDKSLELRKSTIADVREVATEPYFKQLADDLERMATGICSSIPQHVARYGPHLVPGSIGIEDEELRLKAHARREVEILKREVELQRQPVETQKGAMTSDPRRVFVVHGRNLAARDAMFAFLSINLDPIEWGEAVSFTKEASPFTGQVLEHAFEQACAVVVLMTGDDVARLGTRFQQDTDPVHEKELTPQARPNVLFEAGMAFGRHPERTVLVSLGGSRPFSDLAGRNEVRISNGAKDRQTLAGRLKDAGCAVRIDHKTDWLSSGDFDSAIFTPDNDLFRPGDQPTANELNPSSLTPEGALLVSTVNAEFVNRTPEELLAFYNGRTGLQGDKLIEPFKHCLIAVSGAIMQLHADGVGFLVVLRRNSGAIVECRFADQKWSGEFGRKSNGDTLNLKGKISPNQNGQQLYLRDCELLADS